MSCLNCCGIPICPDNAGIAVPILEYRAIAQNQNPYSFYNDIDTDGGNCIGACFTAQPPAGGGGGEVNGLLSEVGNPEAEANGITTSVEFGDDAEGNVRCLFFRSSTVTETSTGCLSGETSSTEYTTYTNCDNSCFDRVEDTGSSSVVFTNADGNCFVDEDADGENDIPEDEELYNCSKTLSRGSINTSHTSRSSGSITVNEKCLSCPDSTTGPTCDPDSDGNVLGLCSGGSVCTIDYFYKFENVVPPAILEDLPYPEWSGLTLPVTAYYFAQDGNAATKDYRRVQFRLKIKPPPPLCYVKAWFTVKVTRYKSVSYQTGATFFCDPQGFPVPNGVSYHYYEREFFIADKNPCINDATKSICSEENTYLSEPLEILCIGKEKTSTPYDDDDALHKETVEVGEGAEIEVRLRKFSYIQSYQPEDPSNNFPFVQNEIVREKVDGYPTTLDPDTRSFLTSNPLPFA